MDASLRWHDEGWGVRPERMSYDTILFTQADGIARLTLNRPDRLNSFTVQMHEEVQHALAQQLAAQPVARRLQLPLAAAIVRLAAPGPQPQVVGRLDNFVALPARRRTAAPRQPAAVLERTQDHSAPRCTAPGFLRRSRYQRRRCTVK